MGLGLNSSVLLTIHLIIPSNNGVSYELADVCEEDKLELSDDDAKDEKEDDSSSEDKTSAAIIMSIFLIQQHFRSI
ncbi:MAG: hypothetical protein EZS28_016749 [Streblomastix strix]|uniref:Uncharacterized protein n=1 Tax=Streblomastix strix TaxID=222440 RepID=A0A5J4VYQ7_9EUKA|nr:MAG: hypothetical protein EZS28_016749 [Streblomastix strix]